MIRSRMILLTLGMLMLSLSIHDSRGEVAAARLMTAKPTVNSATAAPRTPPALRGTALRGEPDDLTIEEESEIDINKKAAESKQLVLNAIKHIQKVPFEKAIDDFLNNKVWRKGEQFVAVFTKDGDVMAHGFDRDLIWTNIKETKGIGGKPLIDEMLAVAVKGGRMSYLWANGFKSAYVKTVEKDGETYIVNVGFYPENNEFATKQLVKTAVGYFLANGKDATFALISNPTGPFIKGDIYMFVYDFEGVNVAHGNNPALIGQNLIDLTDNRGQPIIKNLIKIAQDKGKGWLEYYWRNEFKRSYVEKVVDPNTKIPYMISAGYYPNIDLQVVKSYVNRAIKYLKANGSKLAFAEFSNIVGEFAKGGLGVFVFDLNGKCLANGMEPTWVGQNVIKVQNKAGRFYVKEIIEAAKKQGRALVSYWDKNANAISYVELVETPDGKFVVGSTFYPASKTASAQTLVNRAVDYFKEHTPRRSFDTFSTRDSTFMRGDLRLFIYDTDGTRLVDGRQKENIWRNALKSTDQAGKMVVKDIITIAANGGGWYEYKAFNATRKVYIKPVQKTLANGKIKNYVVGTGYFL